MSIYGFERSEEYCENIKNIVDNKGQLIYGKNKPDLLISIGYVIETSNEFKTFHFDLKSYDYNNEDLNNYEEINYNHNEVKDNQITIKTYEDIPEGYSYVSGKVYAILQNGVKIQIQDISINIDSTFIREYVEYELNEESPIIDLTVYPIVNIEFEIFYCKDGRIVNKENRVGIYKSYKPYLISENFSCLLRKKGVIIRERKDIVNCSNFVTPNDCALLADRDLDYKGDSDFELPIVAYPKMGLQPLNIKISKVEDGLLFKFEFNGDYFSEEILNVNLYLENGEKVTLLKPTIKTRDRNNNPIPYVKGLKYFKKEVSKIDNQLESLGNYEIVGMDYDVYTVYHNTGGGLSFKEKVKPIFTRRTRSKLSIFRFIIACQLQALKQLKGIK